MATKNWLILSVFTICISQGLVISEEATIQATASIEAGLDQLDVQCKPPASWSSPASTVFAIQLLKNTSQTPQHKVVSVYQGPTISWQDSSVEQRATTSGQVADAASAYLMLTISASSTEPEDAATYTCLVSGLQNGALENPEAQADVSLIVPKLCLDGWINNNGSCYHVNREPASWTEAQSMCEHHGGHLAHIQSAEEQEFLRDLLHNIYGHDVSNDYWVGATDWTAEGKWVWEPNNIPLSYTDWFPGQPNNGRFSGHDIHEPGYYDQNCMLLRYDHSFEWIDTVCSTKYFYVCETAILVPPTRPPQATSITSNAPIIIGK